MGCGRFSNGKFDLTVVAGYEANNHDLWTLWVRSLQKASQLLYNATEGQLRFGKIFLANNLYGLETADIVLRNNLEESHAHLSGFGKPGLAAHLAPQVKQYPMILVHELGHYLFALRDEYAGPFFEEDVITNPPSPDPRTIYIPQNADYDDNALAGHLARLRFGAIYERREVTSSNTATVTAVVGGVSQAVTEVVVGNDYSALPSTATIAGSSRVFLQDPTQRCVVPGQVPANGYFCLMQTSRQAGEFDPWPGGYTEWQGEYPSTDLCSTSNHNPQPNANIANHDTAQHHHHGKSCWETLAETVLTNYGHTLTVPNPPSLTPEAWNQALEPEFISLKEERRFALVIDRSGSMKAGQRMANAKFAANYWLDRLQAEQTLDLPNSYLTIVDFATTANTLLPLTPAGALGNASAAVNALVAQGWTNIRDALALASSNIKAPGDRAAVQAIVLLTDGIHNRPEGTSATEAIPQLQEDGVRVFSVGFGESEASVDLPTLQEINDKTCGGPSYYTSIEGMAQFLLNTFIDQLTGGLAATSEGEVASSPPSRLDAMIASGDKRPPLGKVLTALNLGIADLHKPNNPHSARFTTIPVLIEPTCQRASFTTSVPQREPLWLYLIDPAGQAVDLTEPTVRHVTNAQAYEFAVVRDPKPGRWLMVIYRPQGGEALTFRAFAGADTPALRVTGTVSKHNPPGAAAHLSATALWEELLSGLRVSAEIVAPNGSLHTVILHDDSAEEPNSGYYQGFFVPPQEGRYQGTIRVQGTRHMITAQGEHRLSHMPASKTASVSLEPPYAFPFVRVVPISFYAGTPPELKDTESPGEDERDPDKDKRAKHKRAPVGKKSKAEYRV